MNTEMNPVVWFEIPVTDMARAKGFYEYVFGLKLEDREMGPLQMAWFPMKENAGGATGSLVKAEGYEPALAGVLVYLSTADIGSTVARAKDKGGQVIAEKSSIGEYGFIALIQDSEGNRIGLHSME